MRSGSDVVGAATIPPVGAYTSSLSASALRATGSCQSPSALAPPPRQSFDPARQLEPRQQPARVQRHRLGDAHRAAVGSIDRLEDVRAVEIAALRVEATFRLKHEPPPTLGIEQRPERR